MKKWGRAVSEEILTEDFPNLMKDTKIHILDLAQNSSSTKTKTNTPRYILTSGEKSFQRVTITDRRHCSRNDGNQNITKWRL